MRKVNKSIALKLSVYIECDVFGVLFLSLHTLLKVDLSLGIKV